MITAEEFAEMDERVQRGALMLDEKLPGWWTRIDLDALRLDTPSQCVLGQIGLGVCTQKSKSYLDVVEQLCAYDGEDSDYWQRDHGFNYPIDRNYMVDGVGFAESFRDSEAAWAYLDKQWAVVIADRQVSNA